MKRPCDYAICACCSNSILPNETACTVAVPSKRWNRLGAKTKNEMPLKWDCSRAANSFHWSCWKEAVESAAKERSRVQSCAHRIFCSVLDTVERFDSTETVREHAKLFAQYLNESAHTVCFTGAGLSAAAGIPTYRGAEGIDTMSSLGGATPASGGADGAAGTGQKRKADGEAVGAKKKTKAEAAVAAEVEEEEEFSYAALRPTFTHRALAALHGLGKMHYCITQNCDDLHAKGGFPRRALSELHGNVFCEHCEDCGEEYFRDYEVDAYSTGCNHEPWYVECPSCHWGHYTGRLCSKKRCRGKLRDTIVNFGDDLHGRVLGGLPRAEAESAQAGLCVALGSSLTVSPANSLPALASRLVVCNLQETECDGIATLRVWATCDMLFEALFEEMGLSLE